MERGRALLPSTIVEGPSLWKKTTPTGKRYYTVAPKSEPPPRKGWVRVGFGRSDQRSALTGNGRGYDFPSRARYRFERGGLVQISDNEYPRESLTEEEARLRHAEGELLIASIVTEDGDRRDAIFIFREGNDGDEEPIAFYWRAPTKLH